MDPQLSNKVAFVTGGSTGIGKAAAIGYAQAGAHVAICGRTEKELESAARDIDSRGNVLTLQMDVSDERQVQAGIEQIVAKWGRLDFLFANAGINGVWAPIDELSADEWNHTFNVNMRGTFLTIRHSVPLLKKQGGAILITSSVNGTRMFSNTGATAYACTKAAQVALGKMLAVELAEDHIRVNIICPGWIATEIESSTEKRHLEKFEERVEFPKGVVPLTHGMPGDAEAVADLVVFLSSDRARHITGTEIWIDGGQSLLQG